MDHEGLGDIAPDLARHVIEFAFGEVYAGEELSLREREIATVGALTALGTAHPQLVVHIGAALNVGLTREEVIANIPRWPSTPASPRRSTGSRPRARPSPPTIRGRRDSAYAPKLSPQEQVEVAFGLLMRKPRRRRPSS